jgi:hypothetical protein
MMGQSNMCDRGWASELPTFPHANRMFVYSRPQPVATPAEINTHGTWQPATGVIDPVGSTAGQVGALALAFANRMCELFPDDEIGLVPRSVPGVGIDTFVKNNNNGLRYGMALQRMWWAKDECSQYEIAGMLWWQGEGDATLASSDTWSQKFSNLVSDVRVDLQNLNLPVAFVRLNDEAPPSTPYWFTVRQQQEAMTMRNLSMVNIDDLAALADKVHYPTSSYIQIGIRMADAMAVLIN